MSGGLVYAKGGGQGGVWRRSRGFTLMETLVVMTASVLLSVFAVGAVWSSLTTYQFNAATAQMLQDIRYAQQQARVRNGWYGVQFQANPTNSYHVYLTDGSTDTDVTNPANRATTLTVNTNSNYRVTIGAVDIGGGNKVEFDPMGTPYLDKTGAVLAATGTVTLSAGGSSRTVQIFPGTGRVELQ